MTSTRDFAQFILWSSFWLDLIDGIAESGSVLPAGLVESPTVSEHEGKCFMKMSLVALTADPFEEATLMCGLIGSGPRLSRFLGQSGFFMIEIGVVVNHSADRRLILRGLAAGNFISTLHRTLPRLLLDIRRLDIGELETKDVRATSGWVMKEAANGMARLFVLARILFEK